MWYLNKPLLHIQGALGHRTVAFLLPNTVLPALTSGNGFARTYSKNMSKPKVYVTRQINEEALKLLQER